jgi:hypothetical protein
MSEGLGRYRLPAGLRRTLSGKSMLDASLAKPQLGDGLSA